MSLSILAVTVLRLEIEFMTLTIALIAHLILNKALQQKSDAGGRSYFSVKVKHMAFSRTEKRKMQTENAISIVLKKYDSNKVWTIKRWVENQSEIAKEE